MTGAEAAKLAAQYKATHAAHRASPVWFALEAIMITGHINARLDMLQDARKRAQAAEQIQSYVEILQTAAGLTIAQELDTEAGTGGIYSADTKHPQIQNMNEH